MTDWPHSPIHKLGEPGAYIITAGTHNKEPFFNSDEKLAIVQNKLFQLALEIKIELQAWSIFPNHYHFVALASNDPAAIRTIVKRLHGSTAVEVNRLDKTPGRKVWFQYWDTHLTFEKSHLTRLNYVHYNHIHHAVVKSAVEYPWCSAAWFERTSEPSFCLRIKNLKADQIAIPDDF